MIIIGSMILVIIIYLIKSRCLTKSYHKCLTEREKCESYIELRLFDALSKNGYNPKSQVRCGPYRIDIVIGNLAIECDGKAYHYTPEQKRHDSRKNYYLRKRGYKVCRISGKSINNNLERVLKHIEKRAL